MEPSDRAATTLPIPIVMDKRIATLMVICLLLVLELSHPLAGQTATPHAGDSLGLTSCSADDPTLQCGACYRDLLPRSSQHQCNDVLLAVRQGSRRQRDAPFHPFRCSMKWYDPLSACQLLKASNRLLIFVGDSLMRHIQSALWAVLLGNFKRGALMQTPGYTDNEHNCDCDEQFFEVHCRPHMMAYYDGAQTAICPSWEHGSGFLHPILEYYQLDHFGAGEMQTLSSLIHQHAVAQHNGRGLLLLNTALHDNLHIPTLLPNIWEPIFSIAAETNVIVLCVTVHAPQRNKPAAYLETQGDSSVQQWNTAMVAFCESRGAPILDTYAITHNATSFDGTHFTAPVNVVIAQTILNFLAEVDRLA